MSRSVGTRHEKTGYNTEWRDGMTKGITEKEPDPRIVYADIIDLPHHQSSTRPHMSLYDRAAQFASFAALTGYDDMVKEEARYLQTPSHKAYGVFHLFLFLSREGHVCCIQGMYSFYCSTHTPSVLPG